MRFILLATLAATALYTKTATPKDVCPCNTVECQQRTNLELILKQLKLIYEMTPQPKGSVRPPVEQLAPKLLKGWQQQRISPSLLMAIMAVESKFDVAAFNSRTKDVGLMQINARTAQAMKVSDACLLAWDCNLEVGIAIAAYSLKRGNICRYNVGTGQLKGKRKLNCEIYLAKLKAVTL